MPLQSAPVIDVDQGAVDLLIAYEKEAFVEICSDFQKFLRSIVNENKLYYLPILLEEPPGKFRSSQGFLGEIRHVFSRRCREGSELLVKACDCGGLFFFQERIEAFQEEVRKMFSSMISFSSTLEKRVQNSSYLFPDAAQSKMESFAFSFMQEKIEVCDKWMTDLLSEDLHCICDSRLLLNQERRLLLGQKIQESIQSLEGAIKRTSGEDHDSLAYLFELSHLCHTCIRLIGKTCPEFIQSFFSKYRKSLEQIQLSETAWSNAFISFLRRFFFSCLVSFLTLLFWRPLLGILLFFLLLFVNGFALKREREIYIKHLDAFSAILRIYSCSC
ncbi:hypothetical protein HAT2_00558 [Candidatus Similichlamydia laticola]|uniref:Uncharacterized protein n=1 Tax=Candidatus Similichlamydia laticola TaxID=2170265 RepID=A0A369KBP1_9BACT|nr:hypothetical protein HAT2_00558 [Candidatus Similichlamydia laticola]